MQIRVSNIEWTRLRLCQSKCSEKHLARLSQQMTKSVHDLWNKYIHFVNSQKSCRARMMLIRQALILERYFNCILDTLRKIFKFANNVLTHFDTILTIILDSRVGEALVTKSICYLLEYRVLF